MASTEKPENGDENAQTASSSSPAVDTALPPLETADVQGLDLVLSLLAAAVHSSSSTAVTNPYPRHFSFAKSSDRDYAGLKQTLDNMPSVRQALQMAAQTTKPNTSNQNQTENQTSHKQIIRDPQNAKKLEDSKALINFARTQCVQLKKVGVDKVDAHLRSAGGAAEQRPNYVAEVIYPKDTQKEFERLKAEHGSFFAFHGSAIENWHSIVNQGLRLHPSTAKNQKNRGSLFGQGIYLSSSYRVATDFSSGGQGWKRSAFGSRLRAIGLCEVINHPDVQRNNTAAEEASTGRLTSRVPEKYILVTNGVHVVVRYLLLYADSPPARWGWWVAVYGFLLLALVLSNNVNWNSVSRSAKRTMRRLTK